MSNLQTCCHFQLDFQKVDQHTGGKSLIHGTNRNKDNQLQPMSHLHQIKTSNTSISIVFSTLFLPEFYMQIAISSLYPSSSITQHTAFDAIWILLSDKSAISVVMAIKPVIFVSDMPWSPSDQVLRFWYHTVIGNRGTCTSSNTALGNDILH